MDVFQSEYCGTLNQQDIEKLLENKCNLNFAVCNNMGALVKKLLDSGADVNYETSNGWLPLTTACTDGHIEMVHLLLSHGANPNIEIKTGPHSFTPLCTAAKFGHEKVVLLLLQYGADINKENFDGWTPLATAIANKRKDIVELLLKNGANVNQVTRSGWVPLLTAARKGYCEIGKLLLDNGADINYRSDQLQQTAESTAEFYGQTDFIELLIAYCDPWCKN